MIVAGFDERGPATSLAAYRRNVVPMSSMRSTYGAALQVTMRNTAAAYGYTLSTAATLSLLTEMSGKSDAGRLFLFAAGGVLSFALLEAFLAWFLAPLGTTAIYMLVVAAQVTAVAAGQRRASGAR
jgi:hypothetical protein